MPDLKANYDRYLLAGLGLLLGGIGMWLVMAHTAAKEGATLPPQAPAPQPFVPSEAVAQLKQDSAAMTAIRRWDKSSNGASPFVSRVYLLKDDRLVDILEAGNDLFPGIPNNWLLDHGLDYLDTALPQRDPDSDGFTNAEEFAAKTNPRDPKSKPALWTKLQLTDVKIEKLRFTFKSLPTGSTDKVAINTISAENPSELSGATQIYPRSSKKVRTPAGDQDIDENILLLAERAADGSQVFEPTPFRFEEVRVETGGKFNPATNAKEDLMVAVLKNTADGKSVELELDEVKDSPYPLATFLDTRNGKSTEMNLGQVLRLSPEESYKLVDVTEKEAKLQGLATGEQYSVPRAATVSPPSNIPPSEPAQ